MKVLVDTHVMLWWWMEPDRIPKKTLKILSAPDTIVFASAVSAYELAYKHYCGKLPLPANLLETFEENLQAERWTPLPLTMEHSLMAGRFISEHRDPFDRLLAAQSILEKAILVSADPAFQTFPGLRNIW